MALVALHAEDFWGPPMLAGVSLTLDMSYFNPAPEGMKIRIMVTVDRIGPTLANLRCDVSGNGWDGAGWRQERSASVM